MCSLHLRSENSRASSLRAKYLHKLFEILHCLFSPIYLFVCLYGYGPMGIYVTFWFIIQNYFILLLTLFQFRIGRCSVGSCGLLTQSMSFYCCFFVLFCFQHFLPGTTRCSRFILCISFPSPTISHVSKKPYFLPWRMVVETKIWEPAVLAATGFHFFQGCSPRGNTGVCTNPYICTSINSPMQPTAAT